MKRTFRTLLGLVLFAVAGSATAQFDPVHVTEYSTYAGTNSGFQFLPDVNTDIAAPHDFDETATYSGGGEAAWTRRQGALVANQAWLKIANGTTKRASTAGSLSYDFIANCTRIKLDYDLAISQLVWWDDVFVRVYDITTSAMLFERKTLTEIGSTTIDITPGHRYRLNVGLNQNNLNYFSYPEGNVAFHAEGTISRVIGQVALNINSTNPTAAVPITVYTMDNFGLKNGVTPFTRTYNEDTSVTVGAPATTVSGSKAFDHWEKDGVSAGTAKTMTVPMNVAHTINAVYVNAYTLTVNSVNPPIDVPITLYQTDVNGQKNGMTAFNRIYKSGTSVSVNAPATVGANGFVRWEKDGVSMGAARTLTLPMNAAHTVVAVYAPLRFLSVDSDNPPTGVPITVWTKDFNGMGNGNTSFERMFLDGRIVSLTAPAIAGGNYFARWLVDGVTAATGKTLSVTMGANKVATAVYLPGQTLAVQATGVVDPVSILVYQKDINGQQNGTTAFTRLYLQGGNVSMTAPAAAGGKTFFRWEKDGVPNGTTARTITVNMDGAHTLVAVYH